MHLASLVTFPSILFRRSLDEQPVPRVLPQDCIGKDLTRICLPVFFNEPISALQKGAEDMEYSELLDLAAACPTGSQVVAPRVARSFLSSSRPIPSHVRPPFVLRDLGFPPCALQKRLLYVAAFAASSYSSTPGRTRKPFNPLLGETYELVMPEKVCSNRPPASLRFSLVTSL